MTLRALGEQTILVTPQMIEAAERALYEHAARFDIRSLDEMHEETFRLMIEAALSKR